MMMMMMMMINLELVDKSCINSHISRLRRTHGLAERFNGTLKAVLKRMCAERPKDWDRYLPALLFAYREVPQESLGCAPLELSAVNKKHLALLLRYVRDLNSGSTK